MGAMAAAPGARMGAPTVEVLALPNVAMTVPLLVICGALGLSIQNKGGIRQ